MSETLRFWLERIMTVEFWVEALSAFKDLGPLAPICLALVESLIPALPLVAIVTINISAHGAILGFLYSWNDVRFADRLSVFPTDCQTPADALVQPQRFDSKSLGLGSWTQCRGAVHFSRNAVYTQFLHQHCFRPVRF